MSFDVLEHVARPDVIIAEICRVLKKGGLAILIFTPYYGMFAHHLNYISLLPCLQWFFSPDDLTSAVKDVLDSNDALRAAAGDVQLTPGISFSANRKTLPTLNGMTKREFIELTRHCGFQTLRLDVTPILERNRIAGSVGSELNRWLNRIPGADELFSHNVVAILRKP